MDIVFWWKRYGEVFTGISIIIFLVFAVAMIIKDRQLKEEINENCGWGEDDYYCYCEKGQAMEIKNKMDKINDQFEHELEGWLNVSLANGTP